MSEACEGCASGSCEGCESSGSCGEPKSLLEEPNSVTKVKKVIGIVSGKGGVGKSFVTSQLAAALKRKGHEVGILDADITGPSIPKMYDVHGPAKQDAYGVLPAVAADGTKIMSINLLMEDEEAPVIWRGPVIAGTVKQFWTDVSWGDLDYLFVDMPPGTGDVPLTIFQSLPVDGIIVVTSPQELVSLIVKKAMNMAEAMDIPMIGVVENYSYIKCPDCGKQISVFGESKIDDIASDFGVEVLGKLPLNPDAAKAVDEGECYRVDVPELKAAVEKLEKLI